MSIRRITDLPVLSVSTETKGRLLSSFIELSYLSVDSDDRPVGRYESKAMTVSDFVNAIPQSTEFSGRKYFPNGISISTDLQLSGDLYVNSDSAVYPRYKADLKFGEIGFTATDGIGLSSDASTMIKGGSGKILVKSYSGTNGVVELSTMARVNTTISADPSGVVNMAELNAQLEAWKAKILEEVGSREIKYRINLPLLSFIYLDHEITDDEWKKAGTIVDLASYSNLRTYVTELVSAGKLRTSGTGKANDTWYYTLSDGKLTLPKTGWFIQGETGSSVQFKEAGLPQHTHGVRICGEDGMSEWHGRRGNNSKGQDATMDSYNASDPIYGKSSTVQPNATTMFIYFYVGPKD